MNEPIIVDIPTRSYIQTHMKKLHDSKFSTSELHQLHEKLHLDLQKLKEMVHNTQIEEIDLI